MDAQMKALHLAVNRLIRARQRVKNAEKALSRAERTVRSQWQVFAFDQVDDLAQSERHAQARQQEAEEELLAKWAEFSQDYYATTDPNSQPPSASEPGPGEA